MGKKSYVPSPWEEHMPPWQRRQSATRLVATPEQAEVLRGLIPYTVIRKEENRDWIVSSGGNIITVTASGEIIARFK